MQAAHSYRDLPEEFRGQMAKAAHRFHALNTEIAAPKPQKPKKSQVDHSATVWPGTHRASARLRKKLSRISTGLCNAELDDDECLVSCIRVALLADSSTFGPSRGRCAVRIEVVHMPSIGVRSELSLVPDNSGVGGDGGHPAQTTVVSTSASRSGCPSSPRSRAAIGFAFLPTSQRCSCPLPKLLKLDAYCVKRTSTPGQEPRMSSTTPLSCLPISRHPPVNFLAQY